MKRDSNAVGVFQYLPQKQLRGFNDQIGVIRRQIDSTFHPKIYITDLFFKRQLVIKTDGLKNQGQLMISIGTFSQNLQNRIDFGGSLNSQHGILLLTAGSGLVFWELSGEIFVIRIQLYRLFPLDNLSL